MACFVALAVPFLSAAPLLAGQGVERHHTPISSLLPQIESYIEQAMQKTGVPGVAVAIVYNDQVVYLKGFGVRTAGESAPVDENTIFQLASISKPIASTVVASLVGTNDVSWDSKIADLDPDFELSNPNVTAQVTIRDFLSHRSGLRTGAGEVLEDLGFSRPEILHQMRLQPLPYPFREHYEYSNFGYTEGAVAPSKAVHEQWENLAEERLFKPLGMTSTSYRWSDYRDAINKASIHVFVDGKAVPRYLRNADAESPAGGASSSARDLAEWLRLQLADGTWNGEQIVAAEALAETHTPQIQRVKGKPDFYGLGWGVECDPLPGEPIRCNPSGKLIISHSGAFFLGAGTTVRFSPPDQLGILVLTNAVPTGLAEAVAATFFDLYDYGKPTQDWLTIAGEYFRNLLEAANNEATDYSKLTPPSPPAPGKPLSAYVGAYTNDYYGKIEIQEVSGSLWMRLPADGTLYTLTHWSGDTFTYRFKGDPGITSRGVVFNLSGTPQVLIENLALDGNGVFLRRSE